MKSLSTHITEAFVTEANQWKTKDTKYTDIKSGDYIADGPNVNEISIVLSNTRKGFELKRVWAKGAKHAKVGQTFDVEHDHEAMSNDHDKVIQVINYVDNAVTEAKSKYDIEVSVKTARLANEILRDNRNLNYTTDGSNCFIFRNRSEYDEALDILSDGGVEILESVTEANVPTGYVAYDESVELSKGQTLELLMSSKLTTNDIKAIRAAKPFAMKIGLFEVEIAMSVEPKVKNTKALAYDMSKIGGPADVFVVIVKK